MALLIDGKTIAEAIHLEVSRDVEELKKSGIFPRLNVVLVGKDHASHVYVKNKEKACASVGIMTETSTFPESITQEALIRIVHDLNQNPSIHGILVQMPLPGHIRESQIIETIHPKKDVDGLHPVNFGKLAAGMVDGFVPCTPLGVQELLLRYGYSVEGKHVVIVGRSNLVGKPLGFLLLRKQQGGNATVTICHSKSENLTWITRQADILVSAIGRPEWIRADMVKSGAVVVDVGINRIPDPSRKTGNRLVGDVHFEEVFPIAKAITPVPGGVGPMTIVMLLKNTIKAAKNKE